MSNTLTISFAETNPDPQGGYRVTYWPTSSPASATVVNLGVSFLHLNVTEKTEKPIEEVIPKIRPIKEFF